MSSSSNLTYNNGDRKAGFFTPAQALAAFNADFLDADACRLWVLNQIHRSGPLCPWCRSVLSNAGKVTRFWSGDRLRCPYCYRYFSATSNTFLAGKHFDFKLIFLLSILLAAGFDNEKVGKIVGVSPETVRLWRHRFDGLEEIFS